MVTSFGGVPDHHGTDPLPSACHDGGKPTATPGEDDHFTSGNRPDGNDQRRPDMPVAESKYFSTPDDTREFERGRVDLVTIGGSEIGRLTLEPGWRWSEHVKPIVGTELCEAPHFQYHVSGILHIEMADGTTFDTGPGGVTALPQGHDAWVVGDEPVVLVDWWGASDYAKG
jgi:hypothetical protein